MARKQKKKVGAFTFWELLGTIVLGVVVFGLVLSGVVKGFGDTIQQTLFKQSA